MEEGSTARLKSLSPSPLEVALSGSFQASAQLLAKRQTPSREHHPLTWPLLRLTES